MNGSVQDAVDAAKVIAGAIGGGALIRMLQLRSQNRLTDAQAGVQDATAGATSDDATARLIHAATETVAATGPLLAAEIARQAAQVNRLDAALTEVRAEVFRLMGKSTEDRAQIRALTADLITERARSARTDAYLRALRVWAADAVREIRRLDGTIGDPPSPSIDPTPPVPEPRPPTE